MKTPVACAVAVPCLKDYEYPPDGIRRDCETLGVDGRETEFVDELEGLEVSQSVFGNNEVTSLLARSKR